MTRLTYYNATLSAGKSYYEYVFYSRPSYPVRDFASEGECGRWYAGTRQIVQSKYSVGIEPLFTDSRVYE